MTQRAGWNWKRIALVVAVTGFSLVAVGVLAAVGTLYWTSAEVDRRGAPNPVSVSRAVPSGSGAAAAPASPQRQTIATPLAAATAPAATPERKGAPAPATRGEPLRLDISLNDGDFEVRPGPPGGDIQVEGSYADNYYELIHEHRDAPEDGGPVTVIRLEPTSSSLVRMFAGVLPDNGRFHNELTVTIPVDLPVALTLGVSQGRSDLDLGGLTLTSLDLELSMGDHRLDFQEAVTQPLDELVIEARMGNFQLERLGNARARTVATSSRMGNFIVDLDGRWSNDSVAELSFEHSMGELVVRVPERLRIADDSSADASFGESVRFPDADEADPSAPMLRLDVSTTMGGSRISTY